jgi:hypothetical protein
LDEVDDACPHATFTVFGLSGARDEFHLAAIVQNLKTLALRAARTIPGRYNP